MNPQDLVRGHFVVSYNFFAQIESVPGSRVAVHVDDDGDALPELQLVPLAVLPSEERFSTILDLNRGLCIDFENLRLSTVETRGDK